MNRRIYKSLGDVPSLGSFPATTSSSSTSISSSIFPASSEITSSISPAISSTSYIAVTFGLAFAEDVARFLIFLAAAENEPQFLTHMQLQKLMYYVQGWSLALRGRPMFDGRIEAWAHGPVVRGLYPVFSRFGKEPILPTAVSSPRNLSEHDKEFSRSVWDVYKVFSVPQLRNMTHDDTIWKQARGDCQPAEACTTEITLAAMREFFTKKLDYSP